MLPNIVEIPRDRLEDFFGAMMPVLNEKQRRYLVGATATLFGRGSPEVISEITGISEVTISKAKGEIASSTKDPKARPQPSDTGRIRAPGGGRKSTLETDPEALTVLETLLDGNTIGDPESTLTWTVKSYRTLAMMLGEHGIITNHVTVGKMLSLMGYSGQQNKKYIESGNPGPDRDAQFKYIASETKGFIEMGLPVISVDTKKKELIGNYKNGGKEYREKGKPREVKDHDFAGPEGKAAPYGVYDIGKDEGFVSVGISSDTAEFAVNSIRSWWYQMGIKTYPDAVAVMITADCGGSNGRRNRLWKLELQKLADETGMVFMVRHFPPGTSKWNKIEHRMFSFISMNWKGQPLISMEVIVNLISNTKSKTGLKVQCAQDLNKYETGIKVSDKDMEEINLVADLWRGDWNYSIIPHNILESLK